MHTGAFSIQLHQDFTVFVAVDVAVNTVIWIEQIADGGVVV